MGKAFTFENYLKTYVPYLAGVPGSDLDKFVDAIEDNPRVAHPLVLLAIKTNEVPYLKRTLKLKRDRAVPMHGLTQQRWASFYQKLIDQLELLATFDSLGELETMLDNGAKSIEPEFVKCWNSYKVRRDYPENFQHERRVQEVEYA